eukprot:gene19822-11528_t
MPLGTCSALGYVWRQHAHVVEIDFEVGLGSAGKVSVDLAENAVLVGIENRVVISGMLQRDISVNESSWQEKEMSTYVKVTIKLVKALPMLLWDYPVRGPHPATGEMDGQSELEVARFYAKNGDRERCLQHTTAAVAKGSLLCLGKLYAEPAAREGSHSRRRDSRGDGNGGSNRGVGGGRDLVKALENFVLAAEQHKVGEAMYRVGR